jgi:hypothetical protein
VFKPLDSVDCRLCQRHGFANHREYSTHVGRHLEEIALVTLPPIADSDDEDEDDADSEGLANPRPSAPEKHTSLISNHSNKDATVSISSASCDDEHNFLVDVFVDLDGERRLLCQALLHTGSTQSFISESTARRATDLELTQIEPSNFEQLDGIMKHVSVLGKLRLKFFIDDTACKNTFLVTFDDRFDLILGTKFLRRIDHIERLWTRTKPSIEVDSKAELDPRLSEIVIERKSGKPATKFAKKDWQRLDRSEITEACVQDLGFSITEQNGEKRKSLRLICGPVNCPRTFEEDFFILPTGDYEIFLGIHACDILHRASNPGVY